MSLIVAIILLCIEGLILGALARLALPGPDPMGIGETMGGESRVRSSPA